MEHLLIVGSSGHAKVIIDIAEKQGKYAISGLLDASREIGEKTMGYKVIGRDTDIATIYEQYSPCSIFIAIGDNWIRQKVSMEIKRSVPNVKFASLVHPSAQIGKNVSIGDGVVIMAGAVVNSDSTVEDFTIINTKASLDHDGTLSAFASLGPGVTAGGNVFVGQFSAVSIGATIKHGIRIGEHVVIGAGSVVVKNVEDNVVIYGVPAKKIRVREVGEKYL